MGEADVVQLHPESGEQRIVIEVRLTPPGPGEAPAVAAGSPVPDGDGEGADDDIALTVPQTAEKLNISEKHAWTLVHQGEIPSVLLGSSRRVPVRALRDHLDRLTL